jgi:hypothetical protein
MAAEIDAATQRANPRDRLNLTGLVEGRIRSAQRTNAVSLLPVLYFPEGSELGFGALIGPAHGRLTAKKK